MKSIFDELTGYRLKVERDGKEVVNIPGIIALPGALLAPKASIIGAAAASLLGCSIHLEGEDGKNLDIGEKVKKAAGTVADTAAAAAKSVKEEIDKAWNDLSADDPEECPEGEENEEDSADPGKTEDGIPTINVNPDDTDPDDADPDGSEDE